MVIDHLRGKMTESTETIPRPVPPRSEKTATGKAGNKSYPTVKSNVSTDSQKNCTFGKASRVALLFEPADADGNPLKDFLPAGVINISNPDPDAPKPEKKREGGVVAGGDAPQNATPSNKQPPDKTADAKTPAKPSSSDMLGGSILDQIEPTPQQPGDRGMFPKLPNRKAPEDELKRLTKLCRGSSRARRQNNVRILSGRNARDRRWNCLEALQERGRRQQIRDGGSNGVVQRHA